MKRRGELVRVSSLFDKYKIILEPPQATVITTVSEVLSDVCGVAVEKKNIKYSVVTKTITLTVPGIVKQEIARHHSEIINHLRGRLGAKAPTTIL